MIWKKNVFKVEIKKVKKQKKMNSDSDNGGEKNGIVLFCTFFFYKILVSKAIYLFVFKKIASQKKPVFLMVFLLTFFFFAYFFLRIFYFVSFLKLLFYLETKVLFFWIIYQKRFTVFVSCAISLYYYLCYYYYYYYWYC